MTAASLLKNSARNGLQPLDLARHLGGLAQLMELCFSREMDSGGRSLVREMHFLSQFGPLLALLGPLGLAAEAWGLGFVWLEDGRVVGSVNTRRALARSSTWLIANVATHPDYRRRGIAAALTQATLDFIRQQGGAEAILQVDDDNYAAIDLYRQLGFAHVATLAAWVRSSRSAPPLIPSPFDIRLRTRPEWADQFVLAQHVRPQGLAWARPLRPENFQPTGWQRLDAFLSGQSDEHWVVENPQPGAASRLIGSLTLRAAWNESARLVLLVHPQWRGQLERPLLARGLRRLGSSAFSVHIEQPAGDETAAAALQELGFSVTRTLRWMRLGL